MAPQNKPDLSLVDFPMINLGVKIKNQPSSHVSKGENQAPMTHTKHYSTPTNPTLPITKKTHQPDKPFNASGPNLKTDNKPAPNTPHTHQNQQLQTLLTNLTLHITHLSSHISTLSHSLRHAASAPDGDANVLERCNDLLEERDMLEAKMTVYMGHLKLGRMVLEGGCEGVVEFECEDGEGEGEGWGAWRFRIPRPGEWMGGGV